MKKMLILLLFLNLASYPQGLTPICFYWYTIPLMVIDGIVTNVANIFVKKKKRKHTCQQSCEQSPDSDNSNKSDNSDSPKNVRPSNSRQEQEQAELLIEEIRQGNLSIVQQYFDQGIDVNQAIYIENRDFLFIPLHVATDAGYYDIVKAFLDAGANVNIDHIDKNLPPALHIAVLKGYTNIALLLIKKGADVNARDYYNRTPLHEAAAHNFVGMVKLLLENGADTTLRDNEGCTPYDLAIKHKHGRVTRILAEHMNRQK